MVARSVLVAISLEARSMTEAGGRLAKKRVLATGAGTGIGREIALEFALQGADVVLHYSHEPGGAESALKETPSEMQELRTPCRSERSDC